MNKNRIVFFALLGSLLTIPWRVAQTRAQTAATAPPSRKTSEPYTGDLSIFESPGRDERLQINRVMDILGIDRGKTVADIGAGSGWFTVRAARRVGDAGMVYAVDINPEAVHYIDDRAKKEGLPNVKRILSKPDDPGLAPGAVDAVLLAEDLSRDRAAGDAAEQTAGFVARRRQGWRD